MVYRLPVFPWPLLHGVGLELRSRLLLPWLLKLGLLLLFCHPDEKIGVLACLLVLLSFWVREACMEESVVLSVLRLLGAVITFRSSLIAAI